ncbi:MAG: serine/threonine-protein kinase, partial [Gemmatimonadota bacterium]
MPDVLQRLQEALVDRYAVEREIDRGGMAMVFLAEDVRHHRKVAIKVLHPELTTAVGGERFLFEIEIVAGLQHPHILPLHDSGEVEGLLYYVMPFVEGESLRERLEREGPIPVPEAVRIAAEVADGLDYAHRQGVIHRDVKPGNIMLSQKHAVIMDFGIARALTEARDERLTGTGLTLGTPRYASPEQAMGTDTLDGRSDIYSLGCVLYEMLSGEVPLAASTPQAMQQRRIAETPSPLHGVRATIPPVLDHVIAKALAPIPADRFETADQFARALNVVVGATDEDLVAALALTPAGPSTGAGARSRGSGRSLARIGMGVLVLVLVTLAVGWGVRQATAPTEALDPSHIDAVAAMESYDKAL